MTFIKSINKFVLSQNKDKQLLTPGPASLASENLINLKPCFGRGDKEYKNIENKVLSMLKKISGHKHIARLQGSASLALEILVANFFSGKILIIDTGVYSDRIKNMCKFYSKTFKNIKKIKSIKWNKMNEINEKFDWIFACPTETSIALRLPILNLYKLKVKCRARLALDATASIGLEKDHHYADVLAYSSCKGLFGLTGGSFIAFNKPAQIEIKSFYLNLNNHLEGKMTGPYHTILSLYGILKKYGDFKHSVITNKNRITKLMGDKMIYPNENQPLLCSYIKRKLTSKNNKIIFYESRADLPGSVVCHLGEVHLKRKAKGKILDSLRYEKKQ